jgi:hypothetical protein
VSVVCCQVEVSATCRSLVQRGPAECGVSTRVIVRWPEPTGGPLSYSKGKIAKTGRTSVVVKV